MKYDFIIFGGTGIQGRICAKDLIGSGYSVLLVGRDKSKIRKLLQSRKASFLKVDLKNYKNIVHAIKKSGADVVVNCAELIFNVDIMKACIDTKKSVTDLGGLQKVTKKQFKLHDDFKKEGIISITGCGSTPGITNVMVKHAVDNLDEVHKINLGFAWDSNIKKFVIPYSMSSIFQEFTEAPTTLHDGKFIKENRMTCMGIMNFKRIGKQKVYCIVHSEVYTFYRYFKNKGLKNVHYFAGFPDHSMKVIQDLIDTGFKSEDKVNVGRTEVKIEEFTNNVLKKIPVPKGYKEIENIWANIYGVKNKKKVKKEMNCIVKTEKGWEDAGSNIDTGRTIAIISEMIKKGIILEKGVYAPEAVIPPNLFFKELKKRKMLVYENGKSVS